MQLGLIQLTSEPGLLQERHQVLKKQGAGRIHVLPGHKLQENSESGDQTTLSHLTQKTAGMGLHSRLPTLEGRRETLLNKDLPGEPTVDILEANLRKITSPTKPKIINKNMTKRVETRKLKRFSDEM